MTCLFNTPSDLESGAAASPETKSRAEVPDKRKHTTVYSWALEQDVRTLDSRGVCEEALD